MNIERNLGLAQEVLEFVSRGGLLSFSGELDGGKVMVVSRLEDALQYAKSQELPEDVSIWADLKAHQFSEYQDVTSSLPPAEYSALHKELDVLEDRIVQAAWDSLVARDDLQEREELAEDIAPTLAHVAAARFLGGGRLSPFLEELFSLYRSGGWPCGYKGEYPHGKFIVYWRSPR
ncbi:hypothetical protein [Archangium violaceum]|uniref:Uncharacterized protein n=1 Tax=Archangium violaceum Cb vi76 TaxID=1406225 RepID=A0A084SIZ1_9BACT|nr:hypothetical protein [Archangium violaceum]KFA88426.1 hypothetical protein Q664_41115 [Archangium violaceum Cb vi76]